MLGVQHPEGRVHQQEQPGEHLSLGGRARGGIFYYWIHRAGPGHVQRPLVLRGQGGLLLGGQAWVLVGGEGSTGGCCAGEWGAGHLAQLVGYVGGRDVEGGGGLAGAVLAVGAVLLAAPAGAGAAAAVHPRLPTVVPLLGDGLQFHISFFLVIQVIIAVVSTRVIGTVHGDGLHVLMVPGAHVPPGIGHLCTLRAHRLWLGSPPADCKPARVIAFPADDLRQNSSSCINKPVADLQHCQPGFFGKRELFSIARVCIIAVVVQPLLQDLDGIFW